MANNFPPSRGERNAIIGFKPQYEIAAIKIIQAIRQGTLDSIRLADPEAGRVDDFQIISHNRIDGYQVKWSEHPSLVTYKDLISTIGKKPCLIAQLADGWKRLRNNNPGKRAVVHLVMNDNPSPNRAAIPYAERIPDQYHFAGFISQVWNNVRSTQGTVNVPIPIEWRPAWDGFQSASELDPDEFNEFVRDCELEFGYKIPTYEELPTKDRDLWGDQVSQISRKIIDIVADPGASIEYTIKEFLDILGWTPRNQLINIHDFPVNESTYRQIEGLDKEFEKLISNTLNGYIAIIGTPGSGKSTFLTQILKNREERVIKYYSFIPDSFEPVNLRGESKNFLHDITFQLDREGFSTGGSISSFDRNILLKRFNDQMILLHSDWKDKRRKTIFLIDGLDHIQREQHTEFSLVDDLPNPGSIPEGIIFILGSQTDEIFPSAIKSQVRNYRKLEMRPLDYEAVIEIINSSPLSVIPTDDQVSQIFSLSDGHPLALNYLLNMIMDVQNTDEISDILSNAIHYSGNIEQQYQSYWDDVKADSQLFELFGLISRCKSDIDLDWFDSWYDRTTLIKLKNKFSHYFKRYDARWWSFFHNSFRIFILQKTCESGQGERDARKEIQYHRTLAEQSIKISDTVLHSWDEIFHRFNAKQYQEIIDLATPEYFRNQFLNFRAVPDIKEDINFALNSARELKNFVIFSRLILIGTEYEQRETYLDEILYFPLLFRLNKGQNRSCLNHILLGNTLRIKQKKALDISKNLAIASYMNNAKRIFNLSEPIDVLFAPQPIQDFQRYEPELLYAWASSAPYFRAVSDIIELIKKCQQKNPHLAHKSIDEGTSSFQKELLYHVAISCINLEHWADIKVLVKELEKSPHYPFEPDIFNILCYCWENTDQTEIASFFLEKGKELIGNSYLSPGDKEFNAVKNTFLARGIFRSCGDASLATSYLQYVSWDNIGLNFDSRSYSDPKSIFLSYIQYIKLIFYLGQEYKPLEAIPTTRNEKDNLVVEFKRNLYTIAYISAMADIEKKMDKSQIEALISPILKFYHKKYHIFHNHTYGNLIQRTREEFFKFLVYSTIKHGDAAIESLCTLLDEEFNNPENELYWSAKNWEDIILLLYYNGVNKRWCMDKLSSLENSILIRPNDYYDTYLRVNVYFDYAKSWYECGDDVKAKKYLQKAFQTSFGIGFRKDYQLTSWIKWLKIINVIEIDKRIERTIYFAKIISMLHQYVEKRGDFDAAEELISTTFNWSPKRALILTKWFVNQEIISEKYARELFLLELLKSDSVLPIEEIIPLIDIMLYSDEIESIHKQILEFSLSRSLKRGRDFGYTIIKYILESINQIQEKSLKIRWQFQMAEIINHLGIDPGIFNLNIYELKTIINSEEPTSLGLDNKIPPELLLRPVEPEVLIQKLPELKYHSIWEPVVVDIISTYSTEQIQEVISTISNNSDLCILLGRKLLELNDQNGARQAAIKAINECERGGYGLPSDCGSKIEAIKILLKIDKDLAQDLALKTLVEDLTFKYPNFYTIAIKMHKFMPDLVEDNNQISLMWSEIQEYLDQLLSEYTLPSEIPRYFMDEIENDTVINSFTEFNSIF